MNKPIKRSRREYQQAKKNAKALAMSVGPKWIPQVVKNLGFHYSTLSPCGRIYVTSGYFACLGKPFSRSGKWAFIGKTAKEAVRGVIRVARRDLGEIGALMKDLPKV